MSKHIAFCLCPHAPLICIASALEVLRHANRFYGSSYYSWSFLCENDQPVLDSNGLTLQPSCQIKAAADADMSFVVLGFNADRDDLHDITGWIQRQAERGAIIGGISNGSFLLARAGLLDGYQATSHWEDFERFTLTFPRVRTRYQRYVIDRKRMTCSGGTSTLDLFIEITRSDLGNDIALRVSRMMLLQDYSQPQLPGNQMRFDGSHYFSPRVQRALSLLEAGIGEEMNVTSLADQIGVSRRELLRLFRREVGQTPSALLKQRRLERASSLVLHSHLSLQQIATVLGFSSQSHFSSAYKNHFNLTPGQHRQSHRMSAAEQ